MKSNKKGEKKKTTRKKKYKPQIQSLTRLI